jgi:DNA-binding CsgD family transcriptional regulator
LQHLKDIGAAIMSRSHRLRVGDVRTVFRLLGEIRELGADPLAWRRHMLESLGHIVGAQASISGEAFHASSMPTPNPPSVVELGGPAARDWDLLTRFVISPEAGRCPVLRSITDWQPTGRTRIYSQERYDPSFDRRAWFTSAIFEYRRAAGLGDCMYSQFALPIGRMAHVLILNRLPGEAAFTDRQAQQLHLFHEELARLWRVATAAQRTNLPPRQQQVLDGLRGGLSEKQIARLLGLSQHTVHNYVKDLHRHFNVSSRGELLARCAAMQRPDFFPHLTTQPARRDV